MKIIVIVATPCRSGVAGIEKKSHNGMKWKEKEIAETPTGGSFIRIKKPA